MNHPTHRERAEQLLQRAATQLETMSDTDEEFPAFAGVIGTGFAVLAHLDALELPAPGTGDEILAAARKLTDELELDN
ncbi:MAG TPA: hypothetical protein VFG15_27415, partial [Amycolatopsis sp.]|nr:hypothetical protein [Amycolatopsis sp.]